MMIAALGAMAAAPAAASPPSSHPVIELRQYKIAPGSRDRFIDLFDRELVETQEAEGMELVGQFRHRADADRFTWIRAFPNMTERQQALTSFYSGPAWLTHRGAANPMLLDNDNVLLLRPAWPGSGFPDPVPRATSNSAAPARLVVVTIHFLWKHPDERFTFFFRHRLAPAMKRAGLQIEAALVREESANNFPRLPVREGEKLFVWVATIDDETAWKEALARLETDSVWPAIRQQLFDLEERPAQRLLLDPTERSTLR